MKEFAIKYVRKNDYGYIRYSTERIEARGIMHAFKLAGDHAKAIGHTIDSVKQIISSEE